MQGTYLPRHNYAYYLLFTNFSATLLLLWDLYILLANLNHKARPQLKGFKFFFIFMFALFSAGALASSTSPDHLGA